MSVRSPKSEEENQRFRQNCSSILDISPRIRYSGITNKFGRTLAGKMRQGITPLLKPDEARNEYFIEVTRNELRKNFEKSIGRTEYTFTENEKVKILTLSKEDNFYYITIDKDTQSTELASIVESVKRLVASQAIR